MAGDNGGGGASSVGRSMLRDGRTRPRGGLFVEGDGLKPIGVRGSVGVRAHRRDVFSLEV